jgi:hypothetical protein
MPILGIVFNGDKVQSTVDFILEHTELPLLFSIPRFETINNQIIKEFISANSVFFKKISE